ncbi:MAG TPA: hypothetical protein VMG08_10095 [Allosphingosinicella sp.]|nr:hypothetical protein [Allosphingosinicella sp.]
MLVLLAAAAALAPGPLPEDSHWARFSRMPALGRPGIIVRVGIVADRGDDSRDYWFERRLVIRSRRQPPAWADTRRCPGARTQLARLTRLQPHYVPLGGEDVMDIVADGSVYSLEAPVDGGNGNMRIETSSRGPIRAWVDAMLAALEPCWTAARPVPARVR